MGLFSRLRGIAHEAVNAGLDRIEGGVRSFRAHSSVADAFPQPSVASPPAGAPTIEELRSGQVPATEIPDRFGGGVDWGADDAMDRALALRKAQDGDGKEIGDPRAIYWDPYSLVEQLGYKERPSFITYATLDTMVWKVPILNALIQNRVNQVATFCTPQASRFDYGFHIRLRDFRAHPTKAQKKRMYELEDWVVTTGYTDDSRKRAPLEALMRKWTRDLMTFDQVNGEIVPDDRGNPAAWYAVDPKTIRLADTYRLSPSEDLDAVKTVQIFDSVVVGEFTSREMIFEVMNPRSDIRSQGYGTSLIEMLVSTITHLLWATSHNANFFQQGTATPGILNLKGAIPEKQMQAFRREWFQMISGTENAHRTPVTNAEEIQWIKLNSSNRDMEFTQWLDFLIKICAGIFSTDPIEIGFKFGSGGGGKCLAPETEVIMYDGAAKRADQVAIGDQLLGPDSRPRNVLRLASGQAEMYEIIPTRGAAWRCNGAHMVTVVDTFPRRRGEVSDISVDDLLALPGSRFEALRLFPPVEGVEFPRRDPPIVDPYFFGLWVGDGSKDLKTQGVVITKPDPEIPEFLQTVADAWGLRLVPITKDEVAESGWRLSGPWGGNHKENKLRTALEGLWSDGSIHPSIKFGTRNVRIRFLAGFLDTDGSVRPSRRDFSFAQKNEKTAVDAVFIARSLGFRVTTASRLHENGTTYHYGRITGPTECIPTRIPRKQIGPKKPGSRKYDPQQTPFVIKYVGRGPFCGWETDGDHRFLLGDFTVTHNSMFGAADKMKTVESKQKGLRPILKFFESLLNRWIVWPTDPDFAFEFVGLEQMTPKELADLNTQRVRTMYTIDEMRAENDLEPLPDDLGKVILDANWLAHQRMLQQMEQQAQLAQQQMAAMQAQGAPPAGPPGAPPAPGAPSAGGPPKAPPAPGAGTEGLPPAKPLLPGQPTPAGAPTPPVGEVKGDPATPDQIKELESLLQPTTVAEKSLQAMADLEFFEQPVRIEINL